MRLDQFITKKKKPTTYSNTKKKTTYKCEDCLKLPRYVAKDNTQYKLIQSLKYYLENYFKVKWKIEAVVNS